GRPRDELLRLTAAALFRAEGARGAPQLHQAVGQTVAALHGADHFLLRTAEGGWVPVSLTVARLHVGGQPVGLVTARDRREQRALLERVRAGQEELAQVLEAVADGLVVLGADARICRVNAAAER